MKIYRVSLWDSGDDSHVAYIYRRTLREARAEAKAAAPERRATIKPIEVRATAAGIIRALNLYGGHADNG